MMPRIGLALSGAVAGVVVFAVGGITDRGKKSACEAEVSTVQTAIEAYYAKNGTYPVGDTAALNAAIQDIHRALIAGAAAQATQPAPPSPATDHG
jgi:general secretion pathway protein G